MCLAVTYDLILPTLNFWHLGLQLASLFDFGGILGYQKKKLKPIYNWPKKYKKICLVTIQLCIIYIFFDKYKKKIFQLVCLHVNEVYSHIWIMWPSFSFDNLNQEKIGDSKVCAGDRQLADDVIWRKKKCLKKVVTELKTGRVNWSKKSSIRSKGG